MTGCLIPEHNQKSMVGPAPSVTEARVAGPADLGVGKWEPLSTEALKSGSWRLGDRG